jgi:purine-binding chemotaxis protein CheW
MMMENLYLICSIAGQPVAIRAATVDSVVDIGAVSPVPMAPPHVAGLAALRSKLLTIICCERALGFPVSPRSTRRAVIVSVDGHHYGLLVGTIEDASVIERDVVPIRAKLEPGWARVAEGMIEHDGEALLLVDPAKLIAGPEEIFALAS